MMGRIVGSRWGLGCLFIGAAVGTLSCLEQVNNDFDFMGSFGNGAGYVLMGPPETAAGGTGAGAYDRPLADLLIDSKGRYVMAGASKNATGGQELAIWRYFSNGSPDTSFGGDGAVTFGGTGVAGATGASASDIGYKMLIDGQGRYVIEGYSKNAAGATEAVVWRYWPSGDLDTSFGGDGSVSFGPTGAAGATGANTYDLPRSIVLDNLGRIVLGGSSKNAAGGYEIAVWRFLADGSIDTSFGGGDGVWTWGSTGIAGATGASQYDFLYDLERDSAGRWVAVVSSRNAASGVQLILVRFDSSGDLDTSFGGGSGWVTFGTTGATGATGADQSDSAFELVIDSSNRYAVAGWSKKIGGGWESALWRFLSDGSMDTGFGGGDGVVTSGATGWAGATGASQYDYFSGLMLDSAGRYVAVGTSANAIGGRQLLAVRYLSDGTLDTSFGGGDGFYLGPQDSVAGMTGANARHLATSVVEDRVGRYLVPGMANNADGDANTGYQFCLMRLRSDGALDQ